MHEWGIRREWSGWSGYAADPDGYRWEIANAGNEDEGDWNISNCRWYNDQPVSPVALDTVPAARLLGVTPTSFADWVARQDWS